MTEIDFSNFNGKGEMEAKWIHGSGGPKRPTDPPYRYIILMGTP